MSASDKKKLRKESNATAVTERQKAEMKKQKKQTASTVVFIVAMVLVLAVVVSSALSTPVKRLAAKATTAATVGDHKITATELNYFYVDAISNLYSQFDSYGDYQDMYVMFSTGWTPSTAVGEQTYNSETGETWADYFADAAIENAKWTYAMYDAAQAAGFELSESEKTSIETNNSYMELYASLYGYSSVGDYIRAIYGSTSTQKTYEAYYELCVTASAYASAYYNSLDYTADEYRAYETDKMEQYNSYSYAFYYVKSDSYLTGGTKVTDDSGKETTEYSDEEKAAALEAAKTDADALAAGEYAAVEDLNKAIAGLVINKGATTAPTATEYTNQVYSNVSYYAPNEEAVEWLTDSERAAGNVTCVPYTTTDSEGNETTKGYYVLYFVGSIDNSEINVGSVRHLLVAFEEDSNGNVTDDAKKTAKAEAEKLLEEYLKGEKTEEAFTKLIAANSDDSKDGLYENITPDSGYVEAFKNWAIADHEVGDTEIIETEYGYHIMYYVSCNDLSYRDLMIKSAMVTEDYNAWDESITEGVTATAVNLNYIDRDFKMTSSSSSTTTTTK